MTNRKALLNRILTITLIVFIAFIYACQTSTDPDPEPEPEPEPIERVGDKDLIVNVTHRETEAELTGFNINIDGPVTASESGVSDSFFILSGVVSGEYTITISLDGFVNSVITEELEVPTEESADFAAETNISLRAVTPPVAVKNDEATTVQTGKPDEEDAEEDEAVTLEIPANTFPASVVKADGSVDISVTRARPSEVRESDEGLVTESIIFSPEVELNNPITITIPIREISGLENLEYVLEPGSIPLTPSGDGNFVASIKPDFSTSQGFGPTAGFNGFGSINIFRPYSVRAVGLSLTTETGFSQYITISGRCGEALSLRDNYIFRGKTLPGLLIGLFGRSLVEYTTDRRISEEFAARFTYPNSDPTRFIRVEARNKTITYTVRVNNNVLATETFNVVAFDTKTHTSVPCHNSGAP